ELIEMGQKVPRAEQRIDASDAIQSEPFSIALTCYKKRHPVERQNHCAGATQCCRNRGTVGGAHGSQPSRPAVSTLCPLRQQCLAGEFMKQRMTAPKASSSRDILRTQRGIDGDVSVRTCR